MEIDRTVGRLGRHPAHGRIADIMWMRRWSFGRMVTGPGALACAGLMVERYGRRRNGVNRQHFLEQYLNIPV
jgi:hypothetical protein